MWNVYVESQWGWGILSQKTCKASGTLVWHFISSLTLADWWWNSRDQWWDHQKHETLSGHRTDQEWWPQGPSVSASGRRLCPRIWWVKLWKHPFLPWHDSMSVSRAATGKPFLFPYSPVSYQPLAPCGYLPRLFWNLYTFHPFACLHGLGRGLRRDLDSPLSDNQREHPVWSNQERRNVCLNCAKLFLRSNR